MKFTGNIASSGDDKSSVVDPPALDTFKSHGGFASPAHAVFQRGCQQRTEISVTASSYVVTTYMVQSDSIRSTSGWRSWRRQKTTWNRVKDCLGIVDCGRLNVAGTAPAEARERFLAMATLSFSWGRQGSRRRKLHRLLGDDQDPRMLLAHDIRKSNLPSACPFRALRSNICAPQRQHHTSSIFTIPVLSEIQIDVGKPTAPRPAPHTCGGCWVEVLWLGIMEVIRNTGLRRPQGNTAYSRSDVVTPHIYIRSIQRVDVYVIGLRACPSVLHLRPCQQSGECQGT